MTLYYALFSWRSEREVPSDAKAFTAHKRAGWGAFFAALLMIVVVEAIATHLLVSHWSNTVAWILSALAAYSVIWLIGDYRALVLRPIVLSSRILWIRLGMRWQAAVPLSNIKRLRPYASSDAALPGFRRMTVLGDPRWVLELQEPAELEGLFGIRRRASTLGIAVDGEEFERALRLCLHNLARAPTHG
jgi:hypothetical protein